MTRLVVYSAADPRNILLDTSDFEAIVDELAPTGANIERWTAATPLSADATSEEILEAYKPQIDRLKAERGYTNADVIHVRPGNPNWPGLRQKFLSEHTHDEDEVRFFVEGSGAFYLHVDDKVYQVVGTADDLLSVPQGTKHWFDGGSEGNFTVIRLFNDPQGWVAHYTGDTSAAHVHLAGEAVLLDIEGTISPVAFVRDVLFPYARARLAPFVAAHKDDPAVAAILAQASALADGGDPVAALTEWQDRDEKIAPLKKLQGLIWDAGYRSGAFRSPIFPDALAAFQRWTADGLALHVYSSGSLKAQDLFFTHSAAGDLRPVFSGHFDTDVGPKTDAASYARIADKIAVAPARIVFFSDNAKELEAARTAGLQVVHVVKDDTAPAPGLPWIADFHEVDIRSTVG